jgi:hypothetical protein
MDVVRFALTVILGSLLVAGCGGGSSSGAGGERVGSCSFSVGSDGSTRASVLVQTRDAVRANQIESDCRAVARGIDIARSYCGYPLQTRHLPIIERRGELYGFVRANAQEDARIVRHDLPSNVVSLAAGYYMMESDVESLSCHGLGDRLGTLIR